MITKIISGGQTGADQGALDAAIKLGVPHGGWIPKGRLTEDGPLDNKCQLIEIPTRSYSERTEKNVIYSDGTVIISHGKLSDGSKLTQRFAEMHSKPCLHIDLKEIPAFIAITNLHEWIMEQNISVLNVAGPRSSHDPGIYRDTLYIIEGAILFGLFNAPKGATINDLEINELINDLPLPPKTVDDAVDRLISDIELKDRTLIANIEKHELTELRFGLGNYIRNFYGLWMGNDELLESCRSYSGDDQLDPDAASAVIIEALWQRLCQTHKLRIVG